MIAELPASPRRVSLRSENHLETERTKMMKMKIWKTKAASWSIYTNEKPNSQKYIIAQRKVIKASERQPTGAISTTSRLLCQKISSFSPKSRISSSVKMLMTEIGGKIATISAHKRRKPHPILQTSHKRPSHRNSRAPPKNICFSRRAILKRRNYRY